MNSFALKKELAAQRCEICHQTDMFEPQTNHCGRCHQLLVSFELFPPHTIASSTFQHYRFLAKVEIWVQQPNLIILFFFLAILFGFGLISLGILEGFSCIVIVAPLLGFYWTYLVTFKEQFDPLQHLNQRIKWLEQHIPPVDFILTIRPITNEPQACFACLHSSSDATTDKPNYQYKIVRPSWYEETQFTSLPAKVCFDSQEEEYVLISTDRGRIISSRHSRY